GDVLAPGVTSADDQIRPADEVMVVGERAFGVGRAKMSGWEMVESTRGIAVELRQVEEMRGFEEALEIDRQVWSVLPKIQARTLREILGAGKGIGGLTECIAAKHSAEGFGFELEAEEGGRLILTISRCPWRDLMARSGRSNLSERVGSVICNAEYSAWAAEFSEEDRRISFFLESRICRGDEVCTFLFEE
ncbi:MAG: PUA domain-containing protein, partial [Methanothrix sp.]